MKLTLLLLQEALAKYPVDRSRIYATGISMGGYGTWDIIQRKPELFAAAIPICGGGDADPAVPVVRSRDMYGTLKAIGANVRYREYPEAGHDVWTRTYSDTEVLKWLFAQKRPAAAKK